VSKRARDLITKMLVVDPLKRIKIEDIRRHPWFLDSLPQYLCVSVTSIMEQSQIDESVLSSCEKLGFSRHRILNALSIGEELLTSREMAQYTEDRDMAVTYNLLVDQKKKQERKKDLTRKSSSVDKGDTKHLKREFEADNRKFIKALQERNPSPGRWILGKWSKADPNAILLEVYRALIALDFDWKGVTSHIIKARYPSKLQYKDKLRDGKQAQSQDVIKLQIQIYRSGTSDQGSDYIADIQRIYGQTFLFLQFANRILSHLNSCK